MQEQREENIANEGRGFDESAEIPPEDYDSIECNETKVQPIADSILLGSLRNVPQTAMQPSKQIEENFAGVQERESYGSKSKRRSKNMAEGRSFKCQHCEKTYLSYPALYTHMKTKHAVSAEQSSIPNARSRGRPKKVCLY